MTILIKTKQALVGHFNGLNGLTIDPDDLSHGNPSPVAGTWREGQVDGDTAIKVAATAEANLQGFTVFTYDRVNLASLNVLFDTFEVQAWEPATTRDILAFIRARYGILIEPEQIVDEPLSLVGGAGTVTLTAETNALGWAGSCTVDVSVGGALIGDLLVNTNLDGIDYPTSPYKSGSAAVYGYSYNFTDHTDYLLTLNAGEVLPNRRSRSVELDELDLKVDLKGHYVYAGYLRYQINDPDGNFTDGDGSSTHNKYLYINWSHTAVPRGHIFFDLAGRNGAYPAVMRVFGIVYRLYHIEANASRGHYAPDSYDDFINILNNGNYDESDFVENDPTGALEVGYTVVAGDVVIEDGGQLQDYVWVDTTDNIATFEVSATDQIIVDLDQPDQFAEVQRNSEVLEDYPDVITWMGWRLTRSAINVGDNSCDYAVENALFFDDVEAKALAEESLDGVQDSAIGPYVPTHQLLDVFNSTFNETWVMDGLLTVYDLGGAEIIYNGLNDGALPTNQSYKYVMGIKMSSANIDMPGVMYIHYNDTFDPNEV